MMPIAAAGQLPPHPHFRRAAGVIIRGRTRHAAREIDHEADREFGHCRHETRRGARHQDADLGRGGDIDVADIDGAADHGAQFWQLRKDLSPALGHAVGDDDVDILCRLDQTGRIERVGAFVQPDVGDRLQALQGALAVILPPEVGRRSEQDFQDVLKLFLFEHDLFGKPHTLFRIML